MANERYKSAAQIRQLRQQRLLRILRRVSAETAAEVDEPTPQNIRRYNRAYSRWLQELLAESD